MIEGKIKIASLNVRGLQDNQKRRQVFDLWNSDGHDIVFAQECHNTKKDIKVWQTEWNGRILASHGESNAHGMMILINNKTRKTGSVRKWKADSRGRWVICDFKLEDITYTLINVYGPNEDNPDFWLMLSKELRAFANENMVIGGDFNMVMNNDMDSLSRETSHENSKKVIKHIVDEFYLEDIWRIQNPDTKTYTWQCFMNKKTGKTLVASRLDFFLISSGLSPVVSFVIE